jgi:cytochrome c2
MTNAQKWMAVFLVVFVVLFLLNKSLQEDEPTMPMNGMYENQNQTAQANPDGLTLIDNLGCKSCHGEDLNGTNMAPSLYQVKNYWTRDKLINYLRNPSSYNGGERFEAYKQKFQNVVMPSYSNVEVKDLGKIADYLLKLGK